MADPQTGNFPVRVLLDESLSTALGVGQTVAVVITVREKQDALVVPANAVFDLEEGARAERGPRRKVGRASSPVGIRDKQWVEVEGTDLKAGEPVIVEGGWSLPDGTIVKEKETGRAETKKATTRARAEG